MLSFSRHASSQISDRLALKVFGGTQRAVVKEFLSDNAKDNAHDTMITY